MTAHDVISAPHLAKLTVKDFLILAESGAFERYARTELIEGEIWAVNAIHSQHARVHGRLAGEIALAIKGLTTKLEMLIAPSTELSDDTLPEPDIAVVTPSDDRILQGPTVLLAIEISDSTLNIDMGRKVGLYAKYGVPEYWVVDVNKSVIHQMWAAEGEAYAERREVAFGAPIQAATLPGLSVETAGL